MQLAGLGLEAEDVAVAGERDLVAVAGERRPTRVAHDIVVHDGRRVLDEGVQRRIIGWFGRGE